MPIHDDSHPQAPPSAEEAPSAERPHPGITRRGFLKGAGITAAGTALLDGVHAFSQESQAAQATSAKDVRELGPGLAPITLHINGKEHALQVEPRTTLADVLRIHLGMTGTKVICDHGACSGCTVLLDRVPVNSCMVLAVDVGPRKVTTIEGIAQEGGLAPLQTAFIKHDAMQCGFCTPGMVMSCTALLEHNPHPTEAEVRQAVSGNYCRCGTYPKVFAATLEAAGVSTRNT
jgi:aerobic-type carbon monoxide dehydrogenase small subunit (CoxS/CutS family)